MKPTLILSSLVLSFFVTAFTSAQEMPKPDKAHDWLKKFAGDWEVENEGSMGEGQPTMKLKGTMNSQMIGGFWVQNVIKGEVTGIKIHGVQTIGYSAKKKKYVGTWVDGMNDHLWRYEGSIDDSGKKLTLAAEGPSMMESNKMNKYRDSYEFKTADLIIAESSMLGEDGKWITFMKGTMKRVKKKK